MLSNVNVNILKWVNTRTPTVTIINSISFSIRRILSSLKMTKMTNKFTLGFALNSKKVGNYLSVTEGLWYDCMGKTQIKGILNSCYMQSTTHVSKRLKLYLNDVISK